MSAQESHDVELIAKVLAYKAAAEINLPGANHYAKNQFSYYIPTAKSLLENLGLLQ